MLTAYNPLNLVDPSGYDPVGWWPTVANCGNPPPSSGGQGYDAGAYVGAGSRGAHFKAANEALRARR